MSHFVLSSAGTRSAKSEGNATMLECLKAHRAGLALLWIPELTLAPSGFSAFYNSKNTPLMNMYVAMIWSLPPRHNTYNILHP